MSLFASWIEYKDKVIFLTNEKLATKEGKELKKYLDYPSKQYFEDIPEHGAIRKYDYELGNFGKDKENTDFSTPKNFPTSLANAIKNLELTQIGYSEQLLSDKGKELFRRIEQSALADCKNTMQPARAKYEKIEQSSFAEYKKIRQPACAEYEKTKQLRELKEVM